MSRSFFLPDDDEAPPSPPASPVSPKRARVATKTVELQLQQFLDEWNYRILHSSLGRRWPRRKVINALIEILLLNGLDMSDEERKYALKLDERTLVTYLVDRFTLPLREHFEHFAMQVQLVLQTITRVRGAAEAGQHEQLKVAFEEDEAGLGRELLKQAVVRAATEIAGIYTCQESWVADTEERVDRLLKAAEYAEHCNRQFLAIQAQLDSYGATAKDMSKKTLMAMAENNTKTLLASSFSGWLGITIKNRSERRLRKQFEKQIADAEDALFRLKEVRFASIRGVIQRKGADDAGGLLSYLFKTWFAEVRRMKEEGGTKAEVQAIEARLRGAKHSQVAATKRLVTRMSADKGASLISMCFYGLVQYVEEYKKNKAFEDQVKRSEAALKAHMDTKRRNSMIVLNRFAGASETGLATTALQNWFQFVEEGKKARELEMKFNAGETKLRSLQDRQRGNAKSVQMRVNEQIAANLLLQVLCHWQLETKVNYASRYYDKKIEAKRRQLSSVQTIFRGFARQLEEGLATVEGDSSPRGASNSYSQRRHSSSGRGERRLSTNEPGRSEQRRPSASAPRQPSHAPAEPSRHQSYIPEEPFDPMRDELWMHEQRRPASSGSRHHPYATADVTSRSSSHAPADSFSRQASHAPTDLASRVQSYAPAEPPDLTEEDLRRYEQCRPPPSISRASSHGPAEPLEPHREEAIRYESKRPGSASRLSSHAPPEPAEQFREEPLRYESKRHVSSTLRLPSHATADPAEQFREEPLRYESKRHASSASRLPSYATAEPPEHTREELLRHDSKRHLSSASRLPAHAAADPPQHIPVESLRYEPKRPASSAPRRPSHAHAEHPEAQVHSARRELPHVATQPYN